MPAPSFRAAATRVRVPATSANLGPGFDAFGLALSLYDDVVVRVADSGLYVDIAGEGADTLARDERHLVVRSMRAAFDRLGGQPRGLEVVCANRIPHGRGLGSSSAAIVAGIVAARAVTVGGTDLMDQAAVLALASEIEGHPDNVAACILGGFTIAWTDDAHTAASAHDGHDAHAVTLEPCAAVVPLVFIPADPVLTEVARGLLPATVPHADAAANVGRAALLVEAITRRPELLLPATEDRLHQDYRTPAMPDSAALVATLRAQGVAAVISGAGPTVLALTDAGTADKLLAQVVAGSAWAAHRLDLDLDGACVLPLASGTPDASAVTEPGTNLGALPGTNLGARPGADLGALPGARPGTPED